MNSLQDAPYAKGNHRRPICALRLAPIPTLAVLLVVRIAWPQSGPSSPANKPPSATASPTFEVAVIKPATGHRANPVFSHGNVTIRGTFLTGIICLAYDISLSEIDAPPWMNALPRFDVFAKAGSPVSEKQARMMLQSLLLERFKMVVHHETRDTAVEVLTVGKNGPKFKLSEPGQPRESSPAPGHFIEKGISMSELRRFLEGTGPVVDRTGLTGRYDIEMNFGKYMDPTDPHQMSQALNAIHDAVEPELGLKLQWKKVPLDILVIDHAEKIPEN